MLLAAAATGLPRQVRAEESDSIRSIQSTRKDRGRQLLDSLKNRSAAARWRLLQQQQSQGLLPANSADPSSPVPAGLQQDNGPSLVEPFPQLDEIRSAETVQFKKPPLKQIPSKTPRKKRPAEVISPKQLKKVTGILPYHDYSPKNLSKTVPGSKLPRETWTTNPYRPREFEDVLFTWEASDLYHNPLYFEDPALERYGHTYPDFIQPFASVGRFGLQLAGLPYQMTIDPLHKKRYVLGWYRPGECAPKLLYQIPWNSRAATVQAGVVTGLFFLFP